MNWGKGIEEIRINDERLFLKKGLFGWSVVHPIVVDDKLSWKNLILGGSWTNFFMYLGIAVLILLSVNEYAKVMTLLQQCLDNPLQLLFP